MGAVGASDDKCIPNRLRWTVYKAATRLAMSTNIRKTKHLQSNKKREAENNVNHRGGECLGKGKINGNDSTYGKEYPSR